MSVILSQIALIFLVGTTPVAHLQIVEKFSTVEECKKTIAIVRKQEEKEPEDDRIASRLDCVQLSVRYYPDGDGPKKPVSPNPVPPSPLPMLNNSRVESYPCINAQEKASMCRDAFYTH